MRTLALALAVLLLTACGDDDSTSSDVTRDPDSIVFIAEQLVTCSGGSSFCCVKSQFVNTNARTVDVSIDWRAFNAQGQQFAEAIDFISNVGAGATVVSESSFFGTEVTSCSQIARFERSDVEVFAF